MEPVETRLARLEEHHVFIRGELKDIKRMLEPITGQVQEHDKDIALAKQEKRINHKWQILAVAAVSGFFGHVSDKLLHLILGG